jgi:hypothetical protein
MVGEFPRYTRRPDGWRGTCAPEVTTAGPFQHGTCAQEGRARARAYAGKTRPAPEKTRNTRGSRPAPPATPYRNQISSPSPLPSLPKPTTAPLPSLHPLSPFPPVCPRSSACPSPHQQILPHALKCTKPVALALALALPFNARATLARYPHPTAHPQLRDAPR